MGLLGILVGLLLLVWFAYRGWSVLLLAPAAALIAAAFAGEPLLPHWTQTFMGSAAGFVAQFFPLFLLGALFGKLMEDSGAVGAIAGFMTEKLGTERAVLAVVLAGAIVTYGGVSLFVAFFVLAPMAAWGCSGRRHPAAADAGRRSCSAVRPSPCRRCPERRRSRTPSPCRSSEPRPSRLPASASVASAVMLAIGLWWLHRAEAAARRPARAWHRAAGPADAAADDPVVRERAVVAREFDPAEIHRAKEAPAPPDALCSALPLVIVVLVNLLMSFVLLPRMDAKFLAEPAWGGTTLAAVAGVWAVPRRSRRASSLLRDRAAEFPSLRASMDAGANAAVLPMLSVASLVGFGAVVAAMPAFYVVREWVLGIGGGPLVSLAVATNVLAALTGSASGGLTIALDALGPTYMQKGIDPGLMHRIAVIGAGTLDILPHNGAVITLLAVCGSNHRESYLDIVVVAIAGPIVALVAVIALGSTLGSF